MSRHQDQTANHIIESFIYANSTARMAASGFVSGDLGRVAYQIDQAAYYRLTATTPAWIALASVEGSDTAAQGSVTAGTRTYLTASSIQCGKLLVGTRFRWVISITKTAAGTGNTNIDIAVGAAGTTADTARVTFTGATETAAADTATIVIDANVRVVSATGIIAGAYQVNNTAVAGAAAGYKNNAAYVAGASFDNTASNLFVGLCITAGAADVTTVNFVNVMAWNVG
jgi:hypothetical protein